MHALEFRMLGTTYQLTHQFIKDVFGFTKDGERQIISDFKADQFWAFLTDLPPDFDSRKGTTMFIKDHKF